LAVAGLGHGLDVPGPVPSHLQPSEVSAAFSGLAFLNAVLGYLLSAFEQFDPVEGGRAGNSKKGVIAWTPRSLAPYQHPRIGPAVRRAADFGA